MVTTNLVLGGHTFISQLGNDAAPSPREANDIVAACLDTGVLRFDTTYAPERIALGRSLKDLGRREEAFVIAWNFFTHFGPGEPVGSHAPYQQGHLDTMLEELQMEWIDLLIVHPVDDPDEQARQEALASSWLDEGRVRSLGTWAPSGCAPSAPYSVAVAPYNVATPGAAEDFAFYRKQGWQTYATSPYIRGWELDKRVEQSSQSKAEMADTMLRYAAFAPNVEFLIVAMRKVEWVHANVDSWGRGPLTNPGPS